jgi:ubiquinone/menaquinone biosynthesis C-methylase UbiE
VGGARIGSRARPAVTESDYSGSAWSRGPQQVYDRLAQHAVDLLLLNMEADLAGRRALDVGAGTGAMTRALLARGAIVDAADASSDMLVELTRQIGSTVTTTVADIRALPMADDSYDGVAAGFVLNHLHDPAAALRELARVSRRGGYQVATSFGTDEPPVKHAIDRVLTRHGWQPPQWYVEAKAHTMPLTATIEAFAGVAESAGLRGYQVHRLDIAFGDLDAESVALYRLGMAHTAPFLTKLPTNQREELTQECVSAVTDAPPLILPMLVLVLVARV